MRKTENTGYRYDLVSKHRKLLMGCAIIGVLLCHWKTALSSQGIGGNYLAQILNHFGVEGLEIFMFVSGFGLYYSQKKHKLSYAEFLKKRVMRILPDYLVIGGITWIIIDLIIQELGFVRFLEDISFISLFKRGTQSYWYVFAIVVYYALFPIVFHVIERDHRHFVTEFCAFLIVFWLVTAFLHKIMPNYDALDLAIERFPIFTLGAICGKNAMAGKKISRPILWAILISGFGLSGACMAFTRVRAFIKGVHYGLYFYRSWFALAVIIALIAFFEYTEKSSHNFNVFLNVIGCLGGITLELYLFHQSYWLLFNKPYTVLGYFGGIVILPIISAFVYKWIKNNIKRKEKICENI